MSSFFKKPTSRGLTGSSIPPFRPTFPVWPPWWRHCTLGTGVTRRVERGTGPQGAVLAGRRDMWTCHCDAKWRADRKKHVQESVGLGGSNTAQRATEGFLRRWRPASCLTGIKPVTFKRNLVCFSRTVSEASAPGSARRLQSYRRRFQRSSKALSVRPPPPGRRVFCLMWGPRVSSQVWTDQNTILWCNLQCLSKGNPKMWHQVQGKIRSPWKTESTNWRQASVEMWHLHNRCMRPKAQKTP